MENRADELFLKSDSSNKKPLENKTAWKRYALSVIFGVVAMSLILVGIFSRSFIDSMISLLVLSIIAVISAIDYK